MIVDEVREVRLARYPEGGTVRAGDFAVAEAGPAPEPAAGQVLVGLRRLGLNAGLANRIGGPDTPYGPGIRIGDVPASDAVVEVITSRSPVFRQGDLAIRARSPWRTLDLAAPEELRPIPPQEPGIPLEAHLTVLGHVGFTAYVGIAHIGAVTAEDTVYVSGAAGGVGSCAVRLAKARGAHVIGATGSPDKARFLLEKLGADAAIDRHDGPAAELLHRAAPDGITLFFDNVGGDQLEAALEALRFRGRAVICGAASQYGSPPELRRGPANYTRMIYQELTMRGFAVTAHEDLRPRFEAEVTPLVQAGTVRSVHTVLDGFDRVPEAFAALLTGNGLGRMIVAVPGRDDPQGDAP